MSDAAGSRPVPQHQGGARATQRTRWSSIARRPPALTDYEAGAVPRGRLAERDLRAADRWTSGSSACSTSTTSRTRITRTYRDFLLRVGQMMAGAFENGLLMERLEGQQPDARPARGERPRVPSAAGLDEVLQSVARRLCAATAAPNCDIFTLHGDMFRSCRLYRPRRAEPQYVGTERTRLSGWASAQSAPLTPSSPSSRTSPSIACQRLRAAGGPSWGTSPCSSCRSSAAARSSASPASTTTTGAGSRAPTSCTASPRSPPARSPTPRSSTGSTAAPSA